MKRLADAEKAQIEELWTAGLPVRLIGREAGVPYSTVRGYVKVLGQTGAACPGEVAVAVVAGRAGGHLSGPGCWRVIAGDRWPVGAGSLDGVAGGSGQRWPRPYRAVRADEVAWRRALRPKQQKVERVELLRWLVEAGLERRWSPEQIAGWLRRSFPDRPELCVSHETIYQSLYVQARGALRRELIAHLRRRQTYRRPRGHSTYNGQGQLRGTLNISERPPDADDRAVPGHWEGDLIFGKGMTAVATLVERQSRYLMLIALPEGHRADLVADALAQRITQLPDELRRSLTWDQGKEMAAHARFSIETGLPVYFCDPRSPWQRGSNENTNGLLRQYFPKRTSLAPFSQDDLDAIAAELNGRPRQTLGWLKPSEALDQALQ